MVENVDEQYERFGKGSKQRKDGMRMLARISRAIASWRPCVRESIENQNTVGIVRGKPVSSGNSNSPMFRYLSPGSTAIRASSSEAN